MAGFLDTLRNLGRGLLSSASEGAARAVASFAERYDRNSSLIYEQRAHLPRGSQNRLRQQHLTGERAFSQIMRGAGGMGPAGVSWTQDRARQVLYFRRWVFVAADRICSTIASLPPELAYVRPRRKKRKKPGEPVQKRNRRHNRAHRRRLKAYYEARYRKTLHAVKPHEDVESVPDDHPLARLLKKPNAWDKSPGQLWYELVLFLILTGNAYLWVVPDKAFGKPLEMWVIPSQWVMGPKLGPAGEKYYKIMPYIGGAGSFTIPADEIVHFATKNPRTKIDGNSPIQSIAEWIDNDASIAQSQYWAFQNGSQANGAIELGPKYDPDPEQLDAIYSKFAARFVGVQNAGTPMLLPPDAKFTPLTIAPKEMAFLDSSEHTRDSILAALAVPKGIAGITDPGSDRALWGERAVFYEQGVMPWLRYVGEVFTECVCKRWDDELRMFWKDPTPPDPQQVNADITTDAQNGAIAPNEIRTQRGHEPCEDPLMDEPWLDPSKVPLSILKKRFEQEEQQAQQAAMQQQMMAQQQQGPAAAPQESQQQQEQGKWSDQGSDPQADAEDAALAVNDQAWQDESGAVQKAHQYNQRFERARHGWRLTFDNMDHRWKAHNPTVEKSTNDLKGELRRVGKELSEHVDPAPMPGYGQIFLNDNDVGGHEAEVWYVGGDGDEDGFGKVVEEKIREAFPAVGKITYEAESFPPRDRGWVQVYPKQKPHVSVRKSNGDGMHELVEAALEFLATGSKR